VVFCGDFHADWKAFWLARVQYFSDPGRKNYFSKELLE
jgi:hypothetical protein